MSENPMISVVMSVYNGELYLDEAIESILNQTYKDFEFIIINDGATDKSLEIIEKYKNQDDRIVLISRENKGLIASLNEGIEKARGKYIARMDADDISLPKRFEEQVEFMESENIDICGGNYLSINSDGSLFSLNLTPQSHELCTLSLVSKVPFAHPTVMMRKEFLDKHALKYGQSNFQKAEDLDLWIRMHEKGAKFGNVSELILKYRILENSLSKVNDKKIRQETTSMLNDFYLLNKESIEEVLNKNYKYLNNEEESLFVRTVYRIYLKKLKLSRLKLLKKYNKKTMICTLLSEMFNG